MAAGARRRPAAWPSAALLLPLLARAMQLGPETPTRLGEGAGESPAFGSLAPREVEAALERLDAEAEADQEAEIGQIVSGAPDGEPRRLSATGANRARRLAPEEAAGEDAGDEGAREEVLEEVGRGEEVYWSFAKSLGAAVRAEARAEARAEEAEEGPAEEVPAESPEEAMNEEEVVANGPANDSEAGAGQGPERPPEEASLGQEHGTAAPGSPGAVAVQAGPAARGRPLQQATDADGDGRGALRLAERQTRDRSWRDSEESAATSLACAAAFSSYDAVCHGLEWARGQCSFVVTTRGASCSDYCGAQGSECLAAADNAGNNCTVNPLPQGRRGEPTTASFCPARFFNQICVCRPVGPGGGAAGPAALAQLGASAAPEVATAAREVQQADRRAQLLLRRAGPEAPEP